MTSFCVLRRISKLIGRPFFGGLLGTAILSASCCVTVASDDLCPHICSSLFSLFLHVLKVLRGCSSTSHTSRADSCLSLCRNPSWERCFPLLLHLLLSQLCCVALFLKNPIKGSVVLIAASLEQRAEELSQIVIVRLFFKVEISCILQILRKLFWSIPCNLFNCSLNFLLLNAIIFVILILACKSLPRQRSLEEVQENVTD